MQTWAFCVRKVDINQAVLARLLLFDNLIEFAVVRSENVHP